MTPRAWTKRSSRRPEEKTHFNVSAEETFGGEGYVRQGHRERRRRLAQGIGAGPRRSSAKACSRARRSTGSSTAWRSTAPRARKTEATTFHEIQNPNDELAVTYLFYELQRTYQISERHPRAHAGDPRRERRAGAARDRRRLARSSTTGSCAARSSTTRSGRRSTTSTKSFVGAELNIRILEANAQAPEAAGRPNSTSRSRRRWTLLATRTRGASARPWKDSPTDAGAAGHLRHA